MAWYHNLGVGTFIVGSGLMWFGLFHDPVPPNQRPTEKDVATYDRYRYYLQVLDESQNLGQQQLSLLLGVGCPTKGLEDQVELENKFRSTLVADPVYRKVFLAYRQRETFKHEYGYPCICVGAVTLCGLSVITIGIRKKMK